MFNINNYSISELKEIRNDLNVWEWNYLLGPKPVNWDNLPDYNKFLTDTKNAIVTPIIKEIDEKLKRNKEIEYGSGNVFCRERLESLVSKNSH